MSPRNERTRKGPRKVSVWIIDDSEHFCQALLDVLRTRTSFVNLARFLSCEEALAALAEVSRPPNVILLDIDMPQMNGLEAIPLIKKETPATRIIMLTHFDQDENIRKAVSLGANGYMLKSSSPEEICRSIDAAASGGTPLDPFVVPKILEMLTLQSPTKNDYGLTQREKQVLHLLVDGLALSDIADRLFVSHNTIAFHIKRIHEKLQVHSRTALVAKTFKERLL